VVAIYTNIGSSASEKTTDLTLNDAFEAGIEVVDVLSCDKVTVASDGSLKIQMGSAPKAFYPTDAMDGSGLCGFPSVRDEETPAPGAPGAPGAPAPAPSGTPTDDTPAKDAGVMVKPGFVGLGLGLVMAVGTWFL